MKKARVLLGMAAAGLCLVLGSPLAAQGFSAGYKFLDAIKKKDGAAIEEALGATGAKGARGDIIINSRDVTSGDSALHIVIARRDYQWLNYLIYRGADVNIRNFTGTTPLWLAINNSFTDGATLLISKGARVNDPGPAGETPLIAATHQKSLELVRVLIKAGADPARADSSGRTALDYAKLSGSSLLATELEVAVKEAKAKKAKSYGPTF